MVLAQSAALPLARPWLPLANSCDFMRSTCKGPGGAWFRAFINFLTDGALLSWRQWSVATSRQRGKRRRRLRRGSEHEQPPGLHFDGGAAQLHLTSSSDSWHPAAPELLPGTYSGTVVVDVVGTHHSNSATFSLSA
jgi:hypothetical protein